MCMPDVKPPPLNPNTSDASVYISAPAPTVWHPSRPWICVYHFSSHQSSRPSSRFPCQLPVPALTIAANRRPVNSSSTTHFSLPTSYQPLARRHTRNCQFSAMATLVHTQLAQGSPEPDSHLRKMYNGKATEPVVNSSTQRIRDTKYRHVFATHSQSRNSCLSQDAEKPPNFVGFRNLMVLVLSMRPWPQSEAFLTERSCLQSPVDD